jgi:hypothetical protein
VDNSPEQRVLQRYLDHLSQWLSVVPETERSEMLHEVRQHIVALAAAQEWQSDVSLDAMRRALRDFGKADTIGLKLLETWLKRQYEQAQVRQSPAIKRRRLLLEALHSVIMAAGVAFPSLYWLIMLLFCMWAVGGLTKRLLPDDYVSNAFAGEIMFRKPFSRLSFRNRVRLSSQLEAALTGKAAPTNFLYMGVLVFDCAMAH